MDKRMDPNCGQGDVDLLAEARPKMSQDGIMGFIGGKQAVRADEEVVAASELRRLQERVRELERLLGRKTMEVEILKEALDLARAKKLTLLSHSPLPGDIR